MRCARSQSWIIVSPTSRKPTTRKLHTHTKCTLIMAFYLVILPRPGSSRYTLLPIEACGPVIEFSAHVFGYDGSLRSG